MKRATEEVTPTGSRADWPWLPGVRSVSPTRVMSGRFASPDGPLVFGTISDWTGSQRLAVLSPLPLSGLGLPLMASTDVSAARDAAEPPAAP